MKCWLAVLAAANVGWAAETLRVPAQPEKYIDSTGRRAAILGHEDGTFEAWIYPIKVLRDFRLSVYVDDTLEPVPVSQLAEWVEVRPGRATVVHVHPAFTLRQTWAAAPGRAAATVLLSLDTSRRLKIRASFIPEMKPMWPASFGGQSTSWDQQAGVLIFTEGLRRSRPVLGCPLFQRISEQIGHQLPERTVMIEMDITPERARQGVVPIIIAGSRAAYDEELRRVPGLIEEIDRHFEAFDQRTLQVKAAGLDAAFFWARNAIETGWACNDGVGCGLVAGWAPSGLSERPGFGWYFGGDAMLSSWAMTDYGDFQGARAALDFLLDRQRADGKIMHELTQSAALLDWSKYPYGYYHADTTPLMLCSAARYLQRSADRGFLDQHWPQFQKAFRYSVDAMMDPDGLLANERGGAAAVETGALSGKVKRDVYLQGVWLAGLRGYRAMAQWKGAQADAAAASALIQKAAAALEKWFVEDKGYFAFAELKDGTRYEANSGWQGFLVAYGGVKEELARRAAEALARPTLMTPWGTRLFATDSPFYNPLGYNDGSVWPFVTAQAAMALFEHGQAETGYRYLRGLSQATGLSGPGYISEYFSGDRFAEGPHAVPHQLFSSVAMIHPLVSGLLGLSGDAWAGTLRVAPRLPCDLGPVQFSGYRVGGVLVSGTVTPARDRSKIELRMAGGELKVTEEPAACFETPPAQPLRPGDGPLAGGHP
jgi:glycogen debranching enzyme